jgi:hypothetical protein
MNCTLTENYVLSATTSTLAALTWTLGANMVKFSFVAQRARLIWIIGSCLVLIAYVIFYEALALGSELEATPLLATSILFNLVIARFMNGESVGHTLHGWIGTVLMVCGLPMVAAAAAVATCHHGTSISENGFIIYMVIATILIIGMFKVIADGVTARSSKDNTAFYDLVPRLRIVYPLLAAILFTNAWIMFKLAMMELNLRPLIILSIVFIVSHLVVLNFALRLFEAYIILPLFLSTVILLNIVVASTAFGEMQDFTQVAPSPTLCIADAQVALALPCVSLTLRI